ncbi:MAG TPA: DNA-formamidopyrimidine glycosylase family protein [Pyrinomonadaceae bacterium]|nr:DNA-formamidopyrimidine glycosylase family protein [Pyrinomonadaceae bacterium]
MPEFPDIIVYIEALEQRILGQTLKRVQLGSPFLLRTVQPPITNAAGRKVVALQRLGKRICIGLEDELWLVLHLMIAGRLHWHDKPVVASRVRLAVFIFSSGTLSLTEAGSQRRASLHLIQGDAELQRFNPGGLEIFETKLEDFARVLQSSNHTLKRSLTDPRLFSGIGNAYSDEILWHAQLSPIALTQKLTHEEINRLFSSTRETLTRWVELLRADAEHSDQQKSSKRSSVSKRKTEASIGSGNPGVRGFPEKVTAFRPEMAVHGRYGQPCPRCGAKVQRIRYASNETNYCPGCQTGGKLLADRALSRLLRADWPKTAEELEGLTS